MFDLTSFVADVLSDPHNLVWLEPAGFVVTLVLALIVIRILMAYPDRANTATALRVGEPLLTGTGRRDATRAGGQVNSARTVFAGPAGLAPALREAGPLPPIHPAILKPPEGARAQQSLRQQLRAAADRDDPPARFAPTMGPATGSRPAAEPDPMDWPRVVSLASRRPIGESTASLTVLAAARAAAAQRTSDDLKRIRGIGNRLELELNRLGVIRYGDIAAWSPQDVTRINAALGLNARVEREAWVEQAVILAAGGHTDYARRIDGPVRPHHGFKTRA